MSRILHVTACLVVAVGCLLMPSCAGNPVEPLELSEATLDGTVTYNGKPVPHALVIVAHSTDPAAQGTTDAAGNYKIQHAPLGQVMIAVNTEAGKAMAMGKAMAASKGGKGGAAPPTFVDVPAKYFLPETSGVTTTVQDGANTFNIELK